jgi:alginate O-acetyltransferase complex protein AlgF
MKFIKYMAVMLFAMQLGTNVMAQDNPDAGLYDPKPPANSAFLRFINDKTMDGSAKAVARGKDLEYLDYTEISSYFVVPEGNVNVTIGDDKTNFEAKAGNFYSAVLSDSGVTVMTDELSDSPAKAQLIFYNFSDTSNLSVKTSDGSVEIIEPMAIRESGSRLINPAKVPMALYNNDTVYHTFDEMSLDRSRSYSIIAFDKDNIKFIQSTTNTTR